MIAGCEQDPASNAKDCRHGTTMTGDGPKHGPGHPLTLPNIITIARLCGVPVLVWAQLKVLHGQQVAPWPVRSLAR